MSLETSFANRTYHGNLSSQPPAFRSPPTNFATPPAAPPRPRPPTPPVRPPAGSKYLLPPKTAPVLLGIDLGLHVSRELGRLGGSSPDVVSEEQEQRSLGRLPPGENPGHQSPNWMGDKPVTPPTLPPFFGGQIPGARYEVRCHLVASNGNAFYSPSAHNWHRYFDGPIRGLVQRFQNGEWKVLLQYGSNPVKEYHIAGTGSSLQHFVQYTIVNIRKNSDPGVPDQSLPPSDLGTTSPGNDLGIGPVTSPLTSPFTSPFDNPGTPPGDDEKKNRPLGPGDINLPNSFDPHLNNRPINGPDTIRAPNTTPGRTPGLSPSTNTRQNAGKPTYFDEKTPGKTETTPPTTSPPSLLLPPLFMPPTIDRKNGNNTNFSPAPTTPGPSQNTQPPDQCKCNLPLQQQMNRQDAKLDDMSNRLIAFDIALDTTQLAKLDDVLDRLGPKVNGGLSGFLGDKFAKLWNSKALDRALTLLNLAASLHNALMLSRNLGATLVVIVTNCMALIGIKDPEGTAFNFSQMLGDGIENIIKSIIGAENYTNLTESWRKANRIYQAAVNIYQLMTDSLYSITEGLELIGEHTGKIGNALKKSGTVLDNAYAWMNEKFNFKSKKNRAIDKVIEGLQDAQEIASDLAEVTEEFREAQENITEIGNQVNILKAELKTETDAKKVKEDASHNNSQTPDIPKAAMVQPPPPPT